MTIDEARRRLAVSIDRPRSVLDLRSGGIRGIFEDDELDVDAPDPTTRDPFRRALRARLLPHGEGCRLVGLIGPPPWAQALGLFLFNRRPGAFETPLSARHRAGCERCAGLVKVLCSSAARLAGRGGIRKC
ncbi:hypothetical protein ACTOB_004677 [Actinoplanes oblitus]|uniref:Uncharacterized protein n=1 Tax=Actinoplanes oblitus TaxID=3040509 RepID=A0ABY8W4U5_9ACTN|nr:hypothetical protein [Actinoplanes oblitus]WIM92723.1 hypothetical protein ACTOB_004677 [Actinoplanes oblitus]